MQNVKTKVIYSGSQNIQNKKDFETDSSSESEDEMGDPEFESEKNRFTRWTTAAEAGNLSVLTGMFDNMCVDSTNGINGEKTALYLASRGGHAKVVQQLLASGAGVNRQSVEGKTPLMVACQGSHVDVIGFLLKKEADLNLKSTQDETVFHFAARSGSTNILCRLAWVNSRSCLLNCSNLLGETPLFIATAKNDYKMAEALIFYGANIDKLNNEGETALHIAAKGGFNDVGSILLRAGCSEWIRAIHIPKEGEEWMIKNENSHRKCDESSVEKTNPYPRLTPLELAITLKNYDFAALLFKEGEAMNYFKEINERLKLNLIKESISCSKAGSLKAMCFADKVFFKYLGNSLFTRDVDEDCEHIRSGVQLMINAKPEDVDVDEIKKDIDKVCC